MSIFAATDPIRLDSMFTEVNAGSMEVAIRSEHEEQATERSSGTRSPCLLAASTTPDIPSPAAETTAVNPGSSSRSDAVAEREAANEKSVSLTSSGSPRRRTYSEYPSS